MTGVLLWKMTAILITRFALNLKYSFIHKSGIYASKERQSLHSTYIEVRITSNDAQSNNTHKSSLC